MNLLGGQASWRQFFPLTYKELQQELKAISDLERRILVGGLPSIYDSPEPFHDFDDYIPLYLNEEIRAEGFVGNYEAFHCFLKIAALSNARQPTSRKLEAIRKPNGAPCMTIKSLEEDLQVSQPTIQRWVDILSHLYYCYKIAPFGAPKIRAVKKLQKVYLWDWSQVEESGFRFENFVASHLLKYCHFIEDTQGHSMELRYLRDTDGREIDFVVLKNKKPIFAVECKSGAKKLSPHIGYFQQRTNIPEFYQVHMESKDYGHPKAGRVLPFITFCKELRLA